MTPLVKEFIKMVYVADLDPTQMQWFDITEAVKNYSGVDPKVYLLNPAPYKNMMLVGRMGESDFMLSVLVENEVTLVNGWLMSLTKYEHLGSFLFTEHEGQPKVGPVEDEPPTAQNQNLMIHTISAFYASLDKPVQAYIPTPHKANVSRAKRGLKPLYDWHTIIIEPSNKKNEHQGGTHASPRRHQVRGHWRTYKSGKRGWVNECWKGDASKGSVFKDYKFKEDSREKEKVCQ